jgi:hypothetical protein
MGDRRKCQTFAASPAEPGGLPVMLVDEDSTQRVERTAASHRLSFVAPQSKNC